MRHADACSGSLTAVRNEYSKALLAAPGRDEEDFATMNVKRRTPIFQVAVCMKPPEIMQWNFA